MLISAALFTQCNNTTKNSQHKLAVEDSGPLHTDWFLIHSDNDEYAYADKTGAVKIPFGKYGICYTDTFKTFAVVTITGKGFVGIDKKERILFEVFPFDNGPDDSSNGLFRITENGLIGFANTKGEIVIKPRFKAALPFSNKLAAFCNDCVTTTDGDHWSWTGGKWGFIDMDGRIVIASVLAQPYTITKTE